MLPSLRLFDEPVAICCRRNLWLVSCYYCCYSSYYFHLEVHAYDFDREMNFVRDSFKIWQGTAHKYAIFPPNFKLGCPNVSEM